MSAATFDCGKRLLQAQARLRLKLDDELGTLHGLGLDDFLLLSALSDAEGGRLRTAALVRPLGLQASAVVRLILGLEKTGLVAREQLDGQRWVVLRAPARRLLGEAAETAAAICDAALRSLPPARVEEAGHLLADLRDSPALDLR